MRAGENLAFRVRAKRLAVAFKLPKGSFHAGLTRVWGLAGCLQSDPRGMSGSQQHRRKRVLLVDSDYRTSNRLAALLRDDEFDVDVVRDGAAALARLARPPLPEALVTELNLRFVDGASVARYARAQRPGLRVVILTGHPNSVRAGTLGSGPPPVVLTKPLEYVELLSALQEPALLSEAPPAQIGPES